MDTQNRQYLENLLIPVTGPDRNFSYVMIVDSQSANVTPEEARMLRSYLEYMCGPGYYGTPSLAAFIERHSGGGKPFACVGWHNTVTFLKRDELDWAYRRYSWDRGPYFMPVTRALGGEPMPLLPLLDRIDAGGPESKPSRKWEEWKGRHAKIFHPSHRLQSVRARKEAAMDAGDHAAAGVIRAQEKMVLIEEAEARKEAAARK